MLESAARERGVSVSELVRDALNGALRPQLMTPQVGAVVGTVSGSVAMQMNSGGSVIGWTANPAFESQKIPGEHSLLPL
jgi:hypothetical protein